MRKCPRCGYIDPIVTDADRRYDAGRNKKARAAYMRAYRRKQKAEAEKKARNR